MQSGFCISGKGRLIGVTTNIEILREQCAHGNAMFPLMVHRFQTNPQFRERVSCHWHNELEILIVTEGAAQIQIDDKSYMVKEGEMVFVLPNRLHSAQAEVGTPFSFLAVVFDQALLNSFVRDEIQQKYFDHVKEGRILFPEYICREEPWQSQLHAVLIEICERFEKGEKAYELLIKAKLYEVWYLLYTHAALTEGAAGGARDSRAVMIKEVIAYIQAHYEEHIGIPELAERFHVSEGHLCRMFKGMTQKSVVEYLNYYRISVSVELLNMGEHDIGQIAGITGFNNISYFNRMFRRFMRMTPSEYRKLQE